MKKKDNLSNLPHPKVYQSLYKMKEMGILEPQNRSTVIEILRQEIKRLEKVFGKEILSK